ncbi:MAG: hypothetical protein VB049_10660 [Candidatus Pelethousia sp.]|nr:hypothetical protein [Candidatus Pelethousia sp.]
MSPILFSVEDNFPMTDAGIYNQKNISEVFGCNIISLKPGIRTEKSLCAIPLKSMGGRLGLSTA